MQGIRVIDNVVEVELEVDTAAHAASDVVCQPYELVDIALPNGCVVIQTLVLTDYDDQGSALEAVFMREPVTVGANNATFAIPDTQVQHVVGVVDIAATDYADFDQNQVATVANVGIVAKPDPSTPTSLWVALTTSGTPTYAGGRLTLKVGALRG